MKIAISIVSYNTKDLLEACLLNLLTKKIKNDLEIWVVDNNSEDGSSQMVKEKFLKQVHFIQNRENVGFATAHNQVLAKINTDYVLLLNPDTEFDVADLDKMVFFMEQNPKCGVASVKLENYDGSLQSNGGDLPFSLPLISWLFNLESFGIKPNFHRLDKGYYAKPHPVGWVAGTFMFIKTKIFEKTGYLDEKIFMYFEDTLFCYLVWKAGFQVMIDPQITVKHISGASSKDPRLRQWSGEMKGLIYFYRRFFSPFQVFLVKLVIFKVIILRMVAFSLLGKFDFVKTYFKVLKSLRK